MSIIGSNILAGASGQGVGAGYTIENSLRFRSSASAYLSRTPASAGNRKTWTWSAWVKRGNLGAGLQSLFVAIDGSATNYVQISISSDKLYFYANPLVSGGVVLTTTQVMRDPSAWMHIIAVLDTTNATPADRAKLYINGVRVTSFTTNNAASITLNADAYLNAAVQHNIGNRQPFGNALFDGYLAEVNFIDGQALDPSSFGEYNADTGVWQPAAYEGAYGTNGFYLPFSDATNTTTLVADSSGNGNDWTPNNISLTSGVTYDSMTDTPTIYADGGNYAVLNGAAIGTDATLSNGNLSISYGATTPFLATPATIGMQSGKWYWEIPITASSGGTVTAMVGITTKSSPNEIGSYPGANTNGWGYFGLNGLKYNSGGTAYGATYTTNDVIGVAFDADAGTLVFYKNNTSQGTAFSGLTSGTYFPAVGDGSGGATFSAAINFGQRPFAYTPPTGFLPLHTGNLPDSTIVDGSTQMGILTYSGTNGDRLIATGETGIDGEVNFTPDLVWNKSRNTDGYGALWDSVRGGTNALQTYGPGGELNSEGGDIDSFVEGGTNFGTGTINASWGNTSGSTYVSWQWKAGTAFSNDAGTNGATIASVGSVNQDAGFSVVTYTGTGSAATVAHSLGAEPKMVIVKKRNAAADWVVKHASLSSNDSTLILNNPSNQISYSPSVWNNTAPTSSVFSIGTNSASNSANTFVAYCFADVEGYSKFGGYTGNGSTDGTFVHLGFRPKFILVKCSNGGFDWHITDTSRSTYNQADTVLFPNLPNQEANGAGYYYDILSNGFKCRNLGAATNGSGYTYIYMAFAENPFRNALAR